MPSNQCLDEKLISWRNLHDVQAIGLLLHSSAMWLEKAGFFYIAGAWPARHQVWSICESLVHRYACPYKRWSKGLTRYTRNGIVMQDLYLLVRWRHRVRCAVHSGWRYSSYSLGCRDRFWLLLPFQSHTRYPPIWPHRIWRPWCLECICECLKASDLFKVNSKLCWFRV